MAQGFFCCLKIGPLLTLHLLLLYNMLHLLPSQIMLLILSGRLERYSRCGATEVLKPRSEVGSRDQVRLVEDQDQTLAGVTDRLLHLGAAGAWWVGCGDWYMFLG